MDVKAYLKKTLLSPLKKRLLLSFRAPRKILLKYKQMKVIKQTAYLHRRSLGFLKGKDKIVCVFFAIDKAIWKYDRLYQLMIKNKRFSPIILVCPAVNYGREDMLRRLNECYDYFVGKHYNVIKSYNATDDRYIDARSLNPDIIFYTNPYRGLIDDRYYISNFKDILTVYVPYFISTNVAYEMSFNEEMHNVVWRNYCETPYHKKMAVKFSFCKGINTVCTGYPGIEDLLNHEVVKKNGKKTIIWAPHHTLEPSYGVIYYSCFLDYCDFMIKMANKYKSQLDFVFKPHPLLKPKLYLKWGKEKTDNYYESWEKLENTSLNEGEYMELFKSSSAMIHDSASFIVEYLYVNKPVMRTLKSNNLRDMHSAFGLECIANHYLAHNEQDIEQFIQNVINGVDPLKEQRTKFVNEVLMPKGSPSQNIIDDILDSIDNQILYRN